MLDCVCPSDDRGAKVDEERSSALDIMENYCVVVHQHGACERAVREEKNARQASSRADTGSMGVPVQRVAASVMKNSQPLKLRTQQSSAK